MGSKGFFGSIAGNDGVEVRVLLFGSQNSSQSLSFLLPGAEGPGYLYGYRGIGKVDGEIRHFRYDDSPDGALFELPIDPFPFRVWSLSSD